jgi:hypothetical protein
MTVGTVMICSICLFVASFMDASRSSLMSNEAQGVNSSGGEHEELQRIEHRERIPAEICGFQLLHGPFDHFFRLAREVPRQQSVTISSMRRQPLRCLLLFGTAVLLLSYVSLFVITSRTRCRP